MGKKSRASDILRYVVNEELEGRGDRLKAYTIGIDVLKRGDDFDPTNDSIVRVEANRLRQSIEAYYTGPGRDEPVVIALPKGGYRPTFTVSTTAPDTTPKPVDRRLALFRWFGVAAAVLALAILVQQFFDSEPPTTPTQTASNGIVVTLDTMFEGTAESADTVRSARFVEELRATLSRNAVLTVLHSSANDIDRVAADFHVSGSVLGLRDQERLTVKLVNQRTRELVWGRTYDLAPASAENPYGTVVDRIARELHPQIFGSSKKALEGRDPASLSAHQLFVMSTWVPGQPRGSLAWEKSRVALARRALRKDPEFGPAHSVLAGKLTYLASVDGPSNTPSAVAEARNSAVKAAEFSRADANVTFNIAFSQWNLGKSADAVRSMERVIDLDPNHGFARLMAKVFPYSCSVAPDSIIESAAAFDASLDPDNPVRFVSLTWMGILHMNRGEYELAAEFEARAAQIFQTPDTVMRHAAILNRLDRVEEAAALISAQIPSWPNISPAHFSEVTIPRRCRETADASRLRADYDALTQAMANRLTTAAE